MERVYNYKLVASVRLKDSFGDKEKLTFSRI